MVADGKELRSAGAIPADRHGRFNRVNIRKTHPVLHRSITVVAIGNLLLAANFFLTTPTFTPFGVPKTLMGAVFCAVGAWHLFFLTVTHNVKMVRLGSLALVIVWVAWGMGNMQQSLDGRASFQLPIMYFIIAALHQGLFHEPPVNPVTERTE